MNRDDPDRDLRSRFDHLRDEDQRMAPAFATLVRTAERRESARWITRRLGLTAAGIGLVAAGALFFVNVRRAGERHRAADLVMRAGLTTGLWQAPTDFLLETPGRDLLRTVPKMGTTFLGGSVDRRDRGSSDTSATRKGRAES